MIRRAAELDKRALRKILKIADYMPGELIIFEGPDGIGKTTLVQTAADFLQAHQVPFISLSSPGKTAGTLGHLVDRLHHARNEYQLADISPLALQAMHIAAHIDALEQIILPSLNKGILVLLDRTWWSTWVYGRRANVDEAILSMLIEAERLCWREFIPSVAFLIQRDTAFRSEHTQGTFSSLSELYRDLAKREEQRHPVVRITNDDLKLSTDTVRRTIAGILGLRISE